MAFVALSGAFLFGACAAGVDTEETADEAADEAADMGEQVESTEQEIVSGWTPYTSEEYPPIVCDGGSPSTTLIGSVQTPP